jgi:type I restriction enzyme S subunit
MEDILSGIQLPKYWTWVELKDLTENPKSDIVDGPFGSNLKSNEYIETGIPVFKIQNIKENRFVDKKINFISSTKAEELSRHSFQKGDLIVTKLGNPLGLCCKVPDKYPYGIIVADLIRLRPSARRIVLQYLMYGINSVIVQNQLKAITKGTTRPRVNLTIVREINFPLPPLPEQRAIVSKIEELFSELDNGIANLKLAQGQLKVYRQAVLKKAFEGELTREWREQQTDLPDAKDLLEQIRNEREDASKVSGKKLKTINSLTEAELVELPKLARGWCWAKNVDLVHYITSGSRDWKQFYSEKGAYFIRTQDIKTNSLSLKKVAFVDLPNKVEGKRSLVEKDDLLMTITGANVGKVAHINFDIPEAYVSQSVALMKYVDKRIVPFLHYCFQTHGFGATFINKLVYGVGRPVLSLENMREVPISLCSLKEQRQIIQEIETRLSVCDKVEQDIEDNLKIAEALRQSILKKAFEGKLLNERELEEVRSAPDWEPAEALLGRIRAEKAIINKNKGNGQK